MIEPCCEYLYVRCIWLYVIIVPRPLRLWLCLGEKSPKYIPADPLFLVFLTKCFEMFRNVSFEVHYFHKPPSPKKILVVHLHQGIILFAKRSIFNVWQCSEYVCLDNCSVNCTVTLHYVLHQTNSEL